MIQLSCSRAVVRFNSRDIRKSERARGVKPISLACAAVVMLLLVATCSKSTWAQNKIPRVGVLTVAAQSDLGWDRYVHALRDHGLIIGKNVVVELRSGGGDPRRMDEPARELVKMNVDVLFAVGPPSVRATFAATRTIPIVAHDLETDPVAAGYAETYSRPGGNLTGLFLDSPDLTGKSLELLKMIIPKLSRMAVLWDATSGPVPLAGIRSVAPTFGVKLQVLEIHSPEEIDDVAAPFSRAPASLDHLAFADDVLPASASGEACASPTATGKLNVCGIRRGRRIDGLRT